MSLLSPHKGTLQDSHIKYVNPIRFMELKVSNVAKAQGFLHVLREMTQGDLERFFSLLEVCSRANIRKDNVETFKNDLAGWLEREKLIIIENEIVKITQSGINASLGSWEVPSSSGLLSNDDLNKYMLALFQYAHLNQPSKDDLVINLRQMYKDKFEGWDFNGFLQIRDHLKEKGLIFVKNDDEFKVRFDFLLGRDSSET